MDDKTNQELGSTKQDTPTKNPELARFLMPIIATLIASIVATYATYTYNKRQMQLARIEALDKYRSYINSDEHATREYGFFVFEELGYRSFANKLAETRKDPAALNMLISIDNNEAGQIADKIMRKATSPEQKTIPSPVSTRDAGTIKEGWVYLGHFVSEKHDWKTRYLSFRENEKPSDLVGKTFEVRKETGALNVRIGMPTAFGQFREVQEILDAGSRVTILDYSEWHSTGYIWAKVRYGK